MKKIYTALGLMSGTSMDGVDASVIQTDGKTEYKSILNKYFKYPKNIYEKLTKLRDKINISKDLKKNRKQIISIEKDITIFHAMAVNEILKKKLTNIDLIGFHGQTIFHNAEKKISKQLGDGKLLSKLTKKKVVYDFRQNDLKNGGQGAPLVPIFHKLLVEQHKIKTPVIILNIGGITNYTLVLSKEKSFPYWEEINWKNKKKIKQHTLMSGDTGPGNCLIDEWIRKKTGKPYDKNGKIASSGKINRKIVREATTWNYQKNSYDINDFNLFYFRNLSLKDGAASLVEYTAETTFNNLIDDSLLRIEKFEKKKIHFLISGGGRKNIFLVSRIKKKIKRQVKLIDDLKVDGDFIESQAFAYLAIRSFLGLPISSTGTTGCSLAGCKGGVIVKNY